MKEVKEVVDLPLNHPERCEELNIRPSKSVLLFGPSGSGKTLLSRIVAHETNASFYRMSGSEMI